MFATTKQFGEKNFTKTSGASGGSPPEEGWFHRDDELDPVGRSGR